MILVIKASDPHKHTLILSLEFLGFHKERKYKRNREAVRERRERERKEGENEKEGGRGAIKGLDTGRENQSQKEKFETQTDAEPPSPA